MPRFREKAGDVGLKGLIELSFSDWEGRMSSVLFTGGCNFRCPYCHNRDLALGGAGIDDMPYDLVKERLDAQKLWVDSVVITGGEPTLHRGMTAVMADLKSSGYRVKLDTNGTSPDYLRQLILNGLIDCIAMDVKGPLGRGEYGKYSGVATDENRVIDSIRLIIDSGIEHEFRTTIVPGLHQEEDILAVSSMLGGMGARFYKLQNFRPTNTLDPSFMGREGFEPDYFSLLKGKYGIHNKYVGRRMGDHAGVNSNRDTNNTSPAASAGDEETGRQAHPLP